MSEIIKTFVVFLNSEMCVFVQPFCSKTSLAKCNNSNKNANLKKKKIDDKKKSVCLIKKNRDICCTFVKSDNSCSDMKRIELICFKGAL